MPSMRSKLRKPVNPRMTGLLWPGAVRGTWMPGVSRSASGSDG